MKKSPDSGLSFLDHIQELRSRLLFVLLGLVPAFVLAWYFFPQVYAYVSSLVSERFVAHQIYEGFSVRVSVSLVLACLVCLPLLIIQILSFVFPGLSKREKLWVLVVLLSSLLLALAAAWFALGLVIPLSLSFLKSSEFMVSDTQLLLSYEGYISFLFVFLLGFVLVLQFPVLLVVLLRLGVLTRKLLMGFSRFFIPLALLVAALLTPPDVVSQLLLAAPLIAFYYLAILIAKIMRFG